MRRFVTFKESRRYKQNLDRLTITPFSQYLPEPKFALHGHDNEVECVQWSQNANYLLTIGPDCLRIWSNWAHKNDGGYPEQILVEHRPIKLTYPIIREKKEIDVSLLTRTKAKNHEDEPIEIIPNSKKGLIKSPFRMLQNLPAIYTTEHASFRDQKFKLRTPRKIVIKENIEMTPICKIPRVEGHETLPSLSTPHSARNLTVEFQKQKTSRSGKKRQRMTSPPGRRNKAENDSRRSLYQAKESSSINSDESSPSILKFFSPINTNSPKSTFSTK